MSSIYYPFLPLEHCVTYCKQVAERLNLATYDYFYDNRIKKQFSTVKKDDAGNVILTIDNTEKFRREFKVFGEYDPFYIKFKLAKPKTIMKMGLDEYVAKNRELRFHINMTGFSFLYTVEFYEPTVEEVSVIAPVIEVPDDLYTIDKTGQMCMVLN